MYVLLNVIFFLFKPKTLLAIVTGIGAFTIGYVGSDYVTTHFSTATHETVAVATPAPIALDYETAPSDLWEALIAQGYTGDPEDGREALYVNPGTVIDTPGRTYTATSAGWLVCEDWLTTGTECH